MELYTPKGHTFEIESDSEEEEEDYDSSSSSSSGSTKRKRGGTTTSSSSRKKKIVPGKKKAKAADSDDDDDSDVEVLEVKKSAEELLYEEQARKALELKTSLEIQHELQNDEFMKKSRTIMAGCQDIAQKLAKQKKSKDDLQKRECILVGSDAEKSEDEEENEGEGKGNKIKIRLRINEIQVIERLIFDEDPLERMFNAFCTEHLVDPTAVEMKLDGMALPLEESAAELEMEDNEMLEATVDFSRKMKKKAKKRFVLLNVNVEGCPLETYRIAEAEPLKKLYQVISQRNNDVPIDHIVMTATNDDEVLSPDQSASFFDLMNDDSIKVSFVDPNVAAPEIDLVESEASSSEEEDEEEHDANVPQDNTSTSTAANSITLTLRDNTGVEIKLPTNSAATVSSLIAAYSTESGWEERDFDFKLDGEVMLSNKTIEFYDLDDDELIDVMIKAGASKRAASNTTPNDLVKLVLISTTDGIRKKFKISQSVPVSKLLAAYAKKMQVPQSKVTLSLDGEKMKPASLISSFDLEDNDQIDVVMTSK